MAYITIPALPAGATLTGLEVFESVQSSASVKLTANQIKSFTSTNPTLTVSDSATNTVSNAATLAHTTSGTAASGFGTGLAFQSENDAGTLVSGTVLQSIETDPTGGLEFFDFAIRSIVGGSLTEVARFTSAFELGVGIANPAATVHGVSQDLNINGVTSVFRADHTTLSGVAGNGIGSAIEFGVENDAGVTKVGASMDAVVTDVTSGSEDFDLVFNLMNSGAPMSEVMRMKNTGSVGIGTTMPNSRLEVFLSDANNANPVSVSRFTHATSGAPAIGIGTGIELVTETSSNNYEIGGTVYTVATSVASTLEDFDMAFAVMIGGIANQEAMRITHDKFLGVNTIAPTTTIHAVRDDAATNTATPVLRLTHTTSNTPAIGFGTGIEFEAETTPGNNEVGAVIDAVVNTVTATAEDFDLSVKTMTAGAAATEKLRIGNVIYTPQAFGAGTIPTSDAWIHAGAGTTTVALMDLDPGVLLTTPFQGALEYEGRSLYFTPNGTQRSVVQSMQAFQLNADLTGNGAITTIQTFFGKAVAVQAGTRYQYELNATVQNTAATAKSLQYALGGTATLTMHDYEAISFQAATPITVTAANMMQNIITSGFNTLVTVTPASGAAAASFTVRIRGSFDVSAAGTVDFSFGLTAVGTAVTILRGSNVSLWPVGAVGANTQIGDWT